MTGERSNKAIKTSSHTGGFVLYFRLILDKSKRLLLVLSFALSAIAVCGQSVRFFSSDNSLCSSLVSAIYEDSIGYVWICTENGLNRYDGTQMKVYFHDKSHANSLLHNRVQAINNDDRHHLLVGTKQGLQWFDYGTDEFHEIKFPETQTGVRDIFTHNGHTYLATGRLGILELTWTKDGAPKVRRLRQFQLSSAQQTMIDDTGTLLALEDNGTIHVLHVHAKRAQKIASKERFTRLFMDRRGVVFAGTQNHGVYRFDRSTKTFKQFSRGISTPVKAFQQLDADHLYVATDGEGVKLLDVNTGLLQAKFMDVPSYDMGNGKISSILNNRRGDTWIAAYRYGVFFYPNKKLGFCSILPVSPFSNRPAGYVSAVCSDGKGGIWMATDNGGLFNYDSEGQMLVNYSYSDGLPHGITSLFVDSRGWLWVGSFVDELCRLDVPSRRFVRLSALAGEEGKMIECSKAIAEDHHGRLWIGSLTKGLFSIDTQGWHIENVCGPYAKNKKSIANPSLVYSIAIDRKDRVFFSVSSGFCCYDQLRHDFARASGKEVFLPEITINSIYFDERRQQLFGGSEEGLIVYDMRRHTHKVYTTAQGLPSDVVCAISGTASGDIWMSTMGGLAHFLQRQGHFVSYYYQDGLQGNEFSKNVVCNTSNGMLVFGGLNGVTLFQPGNILADNQRFRLVLSEILLSGNSVTTLTRSGGRSVIDCPITEVREIRLGHSDNSFSLNFTSFDASNPGRLAYYYRLGNDDWQLMPNGHGNLPFANLHPGTYLLQVRAESGSAVSDILKIRIIVRQPWYNTWWAWILYLMVVGAIVYFIVQQITERQREQLNTIRLRFFTDISHDIRTPLTMIITPLDQLLSRHDISSDLHQTFQLMYNNANRILQLVNQMLEIRKIDNGQVQLQCRQMDMVSYLQDACQNYKLQAHVRKMQFRFTHSMDELICWADRSILDKVMSNLLGNALKYTPEGGEITVKLTMGVDSKEVGPLENYFQVEVIDTGIGLDTKEIPHLFERFYRSKHSQHIGGTGIGLNLCEALIATHHGSISARNRNDGKQGSCFFFRLPLGHSYLKPEEMVAEEDTEEESTNALSKRHPTTNFKILVIDDEADILAFLCNELRKHYTVASATNGSEGLQIALTRQPDLIICDVMMPGMDGYEFVKQLKHNPNVCDIPVILLTAKSTVQDRVTGLNRGADAYITKPFHLDELNMQIRNLIDNRQRLRGKYSGQHEQAGVVEDVVLESSDEQLKQRIMKAIDQHLDDPDFKIDALSQEVGVSRIHLHRKMKEFTGLPAGEFLRNMRLQQAARLLRENKSDISQIAYACGFQSISVFSTAFKKHYGMTPTQYMYKE